MGKETGGGLVATTMGLTAVASGADRGLTVIDETAAPTPADECFRRD